MLDCAVVSGFEWKIACRGCGLKSQTLAPGERPVCNQPNQRFEVGLRERDAGTQLERSIPGVVVSKCSGLPPDMRFAPPLRCPRCDGSAFESDWGAGRTYSEALALLVDKTFFMLPNTAIRTVGRARELSLRELPACAEPSTLVDIEFLLLGRADGLEGRWYVEAGDEQLRAVVIRELHELLEACGCTAIVEREVWSGIHLTEHRSTSLDNPAAS